MQPDGSIQERPVPPARLQERDEVLAALGMHLEPLDKEQLPSNSQWPTEEMLRVIWLDRFTCSTEEMSGHEAAVELSLPWPDPTLRQGDKVNEV